MITKEGEKNFCVESRIKNQMVKAEKETASWSQRGLVAVHNFISVFLQSPSPSFTNLNEDDAGFVALWSSPNP